MITNNTSSVAGRLSSIVDKLADRTRSEKTAETAKSEEVADVAPGTEAKPLQNTNTSQVAEEPVKEEAVAVKEKTAEAIAHVEEFIQNNQRTLSFEMAEKDNRVIVTVFDSETKEVIRQIPPEDMMRMSDAIKGGNSPFSGGILVNDKA